MWKRRLQTQMRSDIFAFDLVSVISFLSAFGVASDTNGIPEGAVMWLFHLFMKDSSATAFGAGLCSKPTFSLNMAKANEAMSGTYLEVVSYLLQPTHQ